MTGPGRPSTAYGAGGRLVRRDSARRAAPPAPTASHSFQRTRGEGWSLDAGDGPAVPPGSREPGNGCRSRSACAGMAELRRLTVPVAHSTPTHRRSGRPRRPECRLNRDRREPAAPPRPRNKTLTTEKSDQRGFTSRPGGARPGSRGVCPGDGSEEFDEGWELEDAQPVRPMKRGLSVATSSLRAFPGRGAATRLGAGLPGPAGVFE
jgi:hypothetical protein